MKCDENGDECMPYQGHITSKGYGRLTWLGKKHHPARLCESLFRGEPMSIGVECEREGGASE
jgi:hypothetical protein